MFTCERCGSSYSASHIGVEHCPRCQLRDRVQAPLSFKVFQLPDAGEMMRSQSHQQAQQPLPAASTSVPIDAP